MRGNDRTNIFGNLIRRGSPPLARERQSYCLAKAAKRGITPACAGTTVSTQASVMVAWDHPRLRGNDYLVLVLLLRKPGSPPLARERRFVLSWLILKSRITPACAGTTASEARKEAKAEDHPRLRGNDVFWLS